MQPPVLRPSPHVSIIIPMHNDEAWIANAIESCLRQTLSTIEIICVDDASTDTTRAIVERFQSVDPRIQLISHERNRSAFQARRSGVVAASAPYLMFLDGDDELMPEAAEIAVAEATASNADLVGFGVEVVTQSGRSGGSFQKRLQPAHTFLEGDAILPALFPIGTPARGQVWRYLFATGLLRIAYAQIAPDLEFFRANDLPIAYLAIASARRYASVSSKLYRYYFGRGISGQRIDTPEQFEFYLGAIDAVDSIAPAIREQARKKADPDLIVDSYESARLSVIGNLLNYLVNNAATEVLAECLDLLDTKASPEDVVLAATGFCPDALKLLSEHGTRIELHERPVRNVLLTTKTLTMGGVSGVLLAQAQFLTEAGFNVTIAARRPGSSLDAVPHGIRFVEVSAGNLLDQVKQWAEICRRESIDVVIDHQILYSRDWPAYALIARALGAATIGWIHNFAARPVYDLNDLTSLMTNHLGALAQLITLSPLDVAFWKLRGIDHVAYLPNPPSPMILEATSVHDVKSVEADRPVRLLWWGRLEQHTKQVNQLLLVALELRKLGVAFEMDIIGPGWADTDPESLALEAQKLGLDQVRVRGPLYGEALLSAIDAADVFVNTSVIEGYPLTLLEAQARGLPVLMYEMPWLALAIDNDGIVTVPQGAPRELALVVLEVATDAERYVALSKASLAVAERKRNFDFQSIYRELVQGTLSAEFSPEPTLDDARQLVNLLVFFTERNAGLRAKSATPKAARGTAAKTPGDVVRRSPAASSKKRRAAKPAPLPDPWAVRMIRPLGRTVLKKFPSLRRKAHHFNKMVRGE